MEAKEEKCEAVRSRNLPAVSWIIDPPIDLVSPPTSFRSSTGIQCCLSAFRVTSLLSQRSPFCVSVLSSRLHTGTGRCQTQILASTLASTVFITKMRRSLGSPCSLMAFLRAAASCCSSSSSSLPKVCAGSRSAVKPESRGGQCTNRDYEGSGGGFFFFLLLLM